MGGVSRALRISCFNETRAEHTLCANEARGAAHCGGGGRRAHPPRLALSHTARRSASSCCVGSWANTTSGNQPSEAACSKVLALARRTLQQGRGKGCLVTPAACWQPVYAPAGTASPSVGAVKVTCPEGAAALRCEPARRLARATACWGLVWKTRVEGQGGRQLHHCTFFGGGGSRAQRPATCRQILMRGAQSPCHHSSKFRQQFLCPQCTSCLTAYRC